jgi:hypothetical protein
MNILLPKEIQHVRFQVLMAASIKIRAFWDNAM